MPATSANRVPSQTAENINQKIRRQTEINITYFVAHPDQIGKRLVELDREWDIERALETASSTISLAGLVVGITRRRRFLLLPLVVQSFFLQHALQGWCPPLPVFRRLGFRTQREIEIERYALKALRGDFQSLPDNAESRGTTPVLDAATR